jgi:hypothetical protein
MVVIVAFEILIKVKFEDIFGSIITMTILFFAISAVIYWNDCEDHTIKEYKDLPIQSVFNDYENSVNGSFILGTGSFSSNYENYYVVQGKFKRGVKILILHSYEVYVLETNDKKPCIENYYHRYVRDSFHTDWGFSRKKKVVDDWDHFHSDYTIIVPENTVYKQYNIK